MFSFTLYFAIIGIQLTSNLVSGSIPLKCFLQDHSFLDVFDKNTIRTSPHLRFNTLKEKAITLDKNGWVLDTTDLEYEGLDNSVLEEFGFSLSANQSQVAFHTDIVMKHPYKTNGTLFSIPISGEGSCLIKLKNVQLRFVMPFDIQEVNGKKTIELKGYEYWYDVRDNAEFHFSNLYNGNKELSDAMHLLMNQNWKYLTVEFGKIFIDKVAASFYDNFKNYMLSKPLKDFNSC